MKDKAPKQMTVQDLSPTDRQKVHRDGWMNVLTGIGIKGKDKRLGAKVTWQRMTEEDADAFYAGDDMARKIVDGVPDEAFRAGYKLTGVTNEEAEVLRKAGQKILLDDRFLQAWKMARQYGGAGIFMITDAMQMVGAPQPPDASVKALNVLSMHTLYADFDDVDFNILSPTYLLPRLYRFEPRTAGGLPYNYQKIAANRIIRFDGDTLPERLYVRNNYWGDSVINRIKDNIRDYHESHAASANIVQDMRIAVFKIKHLADQIGSEDEKKIVDRVNLVNLTKSIARAVMIDADGEEFDYKTGTVTGIKDLLDKVDARLVSGQYQPRTLLLGESPSGLGGTGRHEQQNWYDYVGSQQRTYLAPKLLQVYTLLAQEQGMQFTNLGIEFNPLYQLDEKEIVSNRKSVAETDSLYIQSGVLDPDEVAKSRFGGDKYNMETDIDMNLRAQRDPPDDPSNP